MSDPAEPLNPDEAVPTTANEAGPPTPVVQMSAGLSLVSGVAAYIGPWRVLRVLGEGGFGVVYQAERKSPAQQAAIKLIKPGMDSQAILARFEAEGQALAIMAHPNIARFYEAGLHGGRPYFAMEYVPGLPITDYADRHKLTLTDRLKLFQQVCHAVQHAHLKAIIHRDIAAKNVLVTEIDGQPAAKVIDFGIAKALSHRLTDLTLASAPGHMIGNPAYMSPEQADPASDVDTRTDVYSLGVLLYELLTGERPFDTATLQRAGDEGIRRLIREVDPPAPSTRLTSLATATEIAAKRQSHLDQLIGTLKGELEWIPLMALRKDRARRYQTPTALADDIEAYLTGRPLTAGPESRIYIASKFLRRNRAAVLTFASVTIMVVAAAGVSIAFALKADRARDEADHQRDEARNQRDAAARQKVEAEFQRDQAAAQRNSALEQAAIAQSVVDWQEEMFSSIRPVQLDNVEKNLQKEAIQRLIPELIVRADAIGPEFGQLNESFSRNYIGILLLKVGADKEAEAVLRKAVERNRKEFAVDHPYLLRSLMSLAEALRAQNRFVEAEALLHESLEAYRRSMPPKHPSIARAASQLAIVQISNGKFVEAEPLLSECLSIRSMSLGTGHPLTCFTAFYLAETLDALHRTDEASVIRQKYRLGDPATRPTTSPATSP